ncbi:hypothetical protein DFH09DRAFT_1278770 [Mycena vulgaris]|nr:hypothetical protein DFH09DRAFT_1278770 [Mycena vulgaris]
MDGSQNRTTGQLSTGYQYPCCFLDRLQAVLRTRESILSWRSDSNPTGPNINLHAAAKPVIKFLYHRQALGYIAKNRGAPSSKETLESCSSYLACRYISSSTKIRILGELDLIRHCEEDARTVLTFVDEWLDSEDVEVRVATYSMLGYLALAGHIPVVTCVSGLYRHFCGTRN